MSFITVERLAVPATNSRTITHYHAHCRTCGSSLGTAGPRTLRQLVATITDHRCGALHAPARYDFVNHGRFTLDKLPAQVVAEVTTNTTTPTPANRPTMDRH